MDVIEERGKAAKVELDEIGWLFVIVGGDGLVSDIRHGLESLGQAGNIHAADMSHWSDEQLEKVKKGVDT